MKKMRLTSLMALLFLATAIVSCKDETTKPAEQKTQEIKVNNIEVILDMVVEEDDTFQLFYSEDGTANFDGDHTTRVDVPGKSKSQLITFTLPDTAKPTHLRLDLGENTDQTNLVVNGLTIKYFKNQLKISGSEFFLNFRPNENIIGEAGKNTIKLQEDERGYDPCLYPTDILIESLKNIVKE